MKKLSITIDSSSTMSVCIMGMSPVEAIDCLVKAAEKIMQNIEEQMKTEKKEGSLFHKDMQSKKKAIPKKTAKKIINPLVNKKSAKKTVKGKKKK